MALENADSTDYQAVEFKRRARRRLVGSIALVLVMIVVLPMILVDKHAALPEQDLVITIPNESSSAETTPSESTASAPVSEPVATSSTPSTDTSNPPTASPVSEPSAAPSNEQKAASAPVMVQIGVFSDANNVKQIQAKLEANGFKVQTSTYATGKIRVRVGPFANKTEAEASLAKLQSLKFNPMVVND